MSARLQLPDTYTRLPSGCGFSTVLPDMDFECFSEAGFNFNSETQKWTSTAGKSKKGGIFAVGSAVYSQHPTTEVLSLAYNLKDGLGERIWLPGCPPPLDLFHHLTRGGLMEAWNVSFEFYIWQNVCVPKLGWPPIQLSQLRCAMAKARAFAMPGKLDNAAKVTQIADQKIKDGQRLINKFCRPRNPTKANPDTRIRPLEDPVDGPKFWGYNLGDIRTEAALSALFPDLQPTELAFWQATMEMNRRGVGVDIDSVEACIAVIDAAQVQYNAELSDLTGGAAAAASEVQKITGWLASRGTYVSGLAEEDVTEALARKPLPPDVQRVLEIRQEMGSAGVKKVYAMARQRAKGDRLHELFIYHGARTGRDTGADVQPQNLVKAGPKLYWCTCGRPYGQHRGTCPFCGQPSANHKKSGWKWEAVESTLLVIKSRSLEYVEAVYGNAILAISGCIRGLFVAGEGKELICSDFASIEAVVTAVLAGEQWRIDAFHRKQDIYLTSASRITGIPLAEYMAHPDGPKGHPDRQKIGKPAELGLGFGGWIGAWRQFDKTDTFTDDEVKANIMAWREASPAIVELWGGQVRGKPWRPTSNELYGLEGMAILAIQNPGQVFRTHGIGFGVKDDILFLQLPSGRFLTYHKPRLSPSTRWDGQLEITFMGWNSNPKMGPLGWINIQTYGGRLAENVIQATARDVMAYSTINAEAANYPVVLRVHDELAAEVPAGTGSIDEFEQIMGTMPPWAEGWPIRAAGGWRGKRYRKD